MINALYCIKKIKNKTKKQHLEGMLRQGRIQDFKLGVAHLKKSRRAEGGSKIVGVFRVKNH
jgi:hypothetical protein